MFHKVLKYSATLIFLMLFSCSQESSVLMTSVEDYSMDSVADGTLLEAGSLITIVFSEIGSRAERVQIVLEDSRGEEIASAEVEPEILKGQGMPMDLPSDLEDGLYYLRFSVFEGDIQLFQEQRYFFIAHGAYSINSLETYPPGIQPGDSITARIVLTSPQGSDPWLRWTLAGELLQEGLLSEMGDGCSFSVPHESGVYSLMVEVFPVSPLPEHYSSVNRHSDLFVTSDEGEGVPWKFIEDRTYLYFIEFKDTVHNRMNPDDIPLIRGNPTLTEHEGYSGLTFSGQDGLHFSETAIPVYADGSVEDFLIAMAFSMKSIPEKGEYSLFQTGDDLNHFSVRFNADTSEFQAEFKSHSALFRSSLPVESIQTDKPVYLELGYRNLSELSELVWISNGLEAAVDEGLPLELYLQEGTQIGSDGIQQGLAVTWYTFAVSSESYELDIPLPAAEDEKSPDPGDSLLLYERVESREVSVEAEEILIEEIDPGSGLASIMVLSDPGSLNYWELTVSSDDGSPLYTVYSVPDDPASGHSETLLNSDTESRDVEEVQEGQVPEKFILSFMNDDRGFFMSSSGESNMAGPFAFQDSIHISIKPGADGSVKNIRSIRFFQD